ncbi:MAG: serpin family protein [Dehalococcoidales bacterium]
MKVKTLRSNCTKQNMDAAVAEGNVSSLVSGNNAFTLKLFQKARKQDVNLIFSPYSISAALAMTWAGARGETETEMAAIMNFILEQPQLHPAFKSLDARLNQKSKSQGGEDIDGFKLRIVNSIWGQKGYQFLPSFLDTLAKNYGTGLNLVDFKNKTEESRRAINDWVLEQTQGKIEELVGQGTIDKLTRLVLTNAIYFKGRWKYPFEAFRTAENIFRLLNGDEIFAPMMNRVMHISYAETGNCHVVELPYKTGDASMVILLPHFGKHDDFVNTLDSENLHTMIKELKPADVNLTMPRFEFKYNLALKQALIEMGMKSAFTSSADFSGIGREGDLCLQDVLHKAFVAVDEEGTEAAAATAAIVGIKSFTPLAVQLKIDRPFIFLIRHIETGAILFMGQVQNPLA